MLKQQSSGNRSRRVTSGQGGCQLAADRNDSLLYVVPLGDGYPPRFELIPSALRSLEQYRATSWRTVCIIASSYFESQYMKLGASV